MKGVLDAAQDILAPGIKPHDWATYGQGWIPKRLPNGRLDLGFLADSALAGVPQAQNALETMGIGRFKWRGLAAEAARQTLGIQHQSTSP